MTKTTDFMNSVKDIMVAGTFGDYAYALEPDVSDGSSYDGFVNYTDGFVDYVAEYTPKSSEHITFKGFTDEQIENAKHAQMILDDLENSTTAIETYWYDNLRDTDKDKWGSEEAFVAWYNDYIPHAGYWGQLDLFTGENTFTETTEPEEDELYEDVQEYDYSWYNESPAFIGVTCRLYDSDNWRGKQGVKLCRLESFFNNDLEYGRESVGSWAGKSVDGSPIGKHVIYTDEFEWNELSDLTKSLHDRLQQAYESIGGEYIAD